MISVRDEITMTQYAYFNTTMGGLVSYDDEEAICDKTEYCLENELHGKYLVIEAASRRKRRQTSI
jgi:chitinase